MQRAWHWKRSMTSRKTTSETASGCSTAWTSDRSGTRRAPDLSRCLLEAERSVQVVAQDLAATRVAQLAHRLGLDLPDPLAGHAVDLADLVERLRLAVGEAEPHRHHARLPLGERVEHRVQLLLEQREADRVGRHDGFGVLDEVTELAVTVLAEGGVQGDRLATVLLDLDDLLRGHVELFGELLRGG